MQEGMTFTTALATASVVMRVWESRDVCSRPYSLLPHFYYIGSYPGAVSISGPFLGTSI